MFFADVGLIESYWREMLLNICQAVYKLIVYLYELFEVVGTAQIITSENLNTLYNRVGLLLGLYMLFRIIISFIQMLINPDYITDKEKGVGNLAKKSVLVIVLIAIVPFLFNKAFELQNMIVGVNGGSNVIAKLVFPTKVVQTDKFGSTLSSYLFTSFYRYDDLFVPDASNRCYLRDNLSQIIISTGGNVGPARYCLFDNDSYSSTFNIGDSEYYKINFTWNGLFAIIVGLVVCYVLLMYVLYVGARVIQLAFLRIIAPMAILGYLSPKKDTIFEKWLKMCTTTYLDLFIRMAIIYFVAFIIYVIIGSDSVGISLAKQYDNMWIVNIVMIIALLIFAKKAPELIKELFPSSGAASFGFGIKSPKKLLDDMFMGQQLWNTAKRAYGAAAVGFIASNRAARKGIGKMYESSIGLYDKLRAIDNDTSLTDAQKKAAKKLERQKFAKDFAKQTWRATGGAAYTGLGGAWRGLGTTNRSGRKTATDNAYKKVQSTYKLRDAGYGWGAQQEDRFRGFMQRDREIEDIIAANEAAIHGLNSRLMKEEENNDTGYTVQKSRRSDKYLIIGPDGKPLEGGKFYSRTDAEAKLISSGVTDTNKIFTPAETQEQIGKLQSQNSALKFEEQKSKKDN